MDVASWLLFALGLVGASDILFYHTLAQRIRTHAPARYELFSHACRGPVYLPLFLGIPNFAFHGVWYWTLLLLLVVDLGISVWDFSLEKQSRRALGGLPTGEYLLHVALAILFGAFVAAVLLRTWNWHALPTRVLYEPAAVPDLLRAALAVMGVANLASGILDARAALRLRALLRGAGAARLS
jgi:hypothetical protein